MGDKKELKLRENETLAGGKLTFTENFNVQPKITQKAIVSEGILSEAKKDGKMVLKPRIEAIHAGRTRNNNIYPAERLKGDFKTKSGVYSFLYPFSKPMLKNHDHDSEPTGRIKNAQFITDSASGRECIVIMPEITDQDTIEKILDGRYLTVSIGATTDSAICNICGTDVIAEGWCGHERGETYEGVQCGWICGDLWFDECSWVNVPADSDAMIVDQGEASVLEAYAQVEDKYYNLSADDNNIEVKESVATMLGLKSADANPDEKGGSTKVPGENLETVAIEEFNKVKESNEALTTQLSEKDTAIAEKDTKITELETQLQEKDTTIAEKDTALAEKDTALAEKDTQIADKDARITELEESKGTVEAERDTLLTEVANLKAASHKALAERVVELKVMLGKVTSEGKAEELEAHVGRSEDSLKDSLIDLQKELDSATFARAAAVIVSNPALGAIAGESASTIVGKDGKEVQTDKDLTREKVYKELFSGNLTKNIKR